MIRALYIASLFVVLSTIFVFVVWGISWLASIAFNVQALTLFQSVVIVFALQILSIMSKAATPK